MNPLLESNFVLGMRCSGVGTYTQKIMHLYEFALKS